MKSAGWATLGFSTAVVVASGAAFFLYVPVLVIGGAWIFLSAVLLSLWLGLEMGRALENRNASAKSGNGYVPNAESGAGSNIMSVSGVSGSGVPLEQLSNRAAVH